VGMVALLQARPPRLPRLLLGGIATSSLLLLLLLNVLLAPPPTLRAPALSR
jgi:hypothetical protein